MLERYSTPEMAAIWSPENRFDKWLEVEIAAGEAWAELGVVPKEALPRIRQATYDLDEIAAFEKETQHEVTAFLRSVARRLGEASRFVHLGLTSSDVMDTGLALQIRDGCALLAQDMRALLEVMERLALAHKDTVMIGRTHGVHAEPITFGFKVAVWVDEIRRHLERLAQAQGQAAVGKISGAVGTHATVPPEVEDYVCRRLGLKPEPVSTQIVHRDRHAQVIATLALIASSLEKIATEIRGLQRTEVLEVEEPFGEGQQGSSAMPHKRNPVLSERVCGLARVVRSHALTAMENVALWHERDISHSSAERFVFPESFILLDYMVRLLTTILVGLEVHPERMAENLARTRGLIFSQRILLALMDKGLGRETAYRMVQDNARRVWRGEGDFLALLRQDPRVQEHLSEEELAGLFDCQYYLRHIDAAFRRLGLAEPRRSEV